MTPEVITAIKVAGIAGIIFGAGIAFAGLIIYGRAKGRFPRWLRKAAGMLPVLALICLMGIWSAAQAGQVTKLVWDAPTTNADGTPLDDLDGFKIYCGPSSGNYTLRGTTLASVTQVAISSVVNETGMVYCAVTAFDVWANESGYSGEVRFSSQGTNFFGEDGVPPGIPGNLRTE